MSPYLSQKIKVISFFLVILVVYIHSADQPVSSIEKGYDSFIREFISGGLCRIAIPLFFIISGYLFFISFKEGSAHEFARKGRTRFRTLLLPYLLWSVYGILFYLVMQSVPQAKPFFTRELIRDYSLMQWPDRIFVHPIPYQLWYVRDLMLLVLLSPVIYMLVRNLRFIILLPFLLLWFMRVNLVILSNESLLFFSFGAWLGIGKISLQYDIPQKGRMLLLSAWVLLISWKALLLHAGLGSIALTGFLHKTAILVGVPAVWFLYDRLTENREITSSRFHSLFSYTFFIYAFHEPVLTVVKKVLFFLSGTTQFISLMVYLSAPVFTIILAVLCASLLKRSLPRFYSVITGGR